jgi:hypothetical protein
MILRHIPQNLKSKTVKKNIKIPLRLCASVVKKFLLLILSLSPFLLFSQSQDSIIIKSIFDEGLANGKAYDNLKYLCINSPARLSGSANAAKAVEWTAKRLEEMGADTVYLQEVMVPHWVRGEKEIAKVSQQKIITLPPDHGGKYGESPVNIQDVEIELDICALGGSIATESAGIKAEIIEVKSLDELKQLGKEKIKGKIVFYNRCMEHKCYDAFTAYGGAIDQRLWGPAEAAKFGAIAVIIRSLNLSNDDYPHTGTLIYNDSIPKIPAAAISTNSANILSSRLKGNANLQLFLKMNCKTLPDTLSYNVIAEIKGSKYPDEIIVVGGHLDSWDLSQGAHDDGAGCVQSMEVISLFKSLNIQPERTIRCVLFMNEENGARGGKKYAETAIAKNENHIVAIESDAGGFSPRGFEVAGKEEIIVSCLNMLSNWKPLFEPYGVYFFTKGFGGVDIRGLKECNTALIGLSPDSQRYFDYHHAKTDNIDAVNKRELELGATSIASLVYLFDKYGLNISK